MNPPSQWEEVERLFHAVADLPRGERRMLLAAASPEVRAEVESLLETDSTGSLDGPPAHLAADLLNRPRGALTRGKRIGSYRVESLISIGGMGEVYLAREPSRRLVAVKVLRGHLLLNPQAVARFQTEARAASALHHPNIVTVFESGESDAGLFMAMEWVDGRTLRKLIREATVTVAQAIDWGTQAARALAAAHAAGILHRDIKPDNIMLGKDGIVKILDFGLARLAGPRLPEADSIGASGTISGTLSGTLLYMAPELLRGEPATCASDVFSLGAVLYELAAGRHPFAGETPLDIFEAIELRTVAAPSSVRGGIPPEMDTLILRLLERDAALRPPAAEIRDVLSTVSVRT